jgi:hypothetical protein
MPNQQLIDYIKSQHARCFSYDQIREFLINSGYNPDDVKNSVKLAQKKKHPMIWISSVLIIIIAGTYFTLSLIQFEPEIEEPLVQQPQQHVTYCMQLPCFMERFKSCSKAQVRVDLNKTVYLYEVLGMVNDKCEVRIRSIIHKNTEWRGKEMRCMMNTDNFIDPLQNRSNCSGFLKNLLDQPI